MSVEVWGNTLWFERLLAELGHEAAVRCWLFALGP
jgi:hypothetical protein